MYALYFTCYIITVAQIQNVRPNKNTYISKAWSNSFTDGARFERSETCALGLPGLDRALSCPPTPAGPRPSDLLLTAAFFNLFIIYICLDSKPNSFPCLAHSHFPLLLKLLYLPRLKGLWFSVIFLCLPWTCQLALGTWPLISHQLWLVDGEGKGAGQYNPALTLLCSH